MFHREQGEVYQRLLSGESLILSAPTSFGKSRVIDAVIASGKFSNIAIIVPTLALIDETRRRLAGFSSDYKIVTHLSQKPSIRNIFVLTAERAVAYQGFPKIEFFVIDEFYKIDALHEDKARTVSLNMAFQKFLKMGGQFYMLGPNVDRIPRGLQEKYRCYFYPTNFTTVVTEQSKVGGDGDDLARLVSLCRTLKESTLIFCRSPARVNEVAETLLAARIGVPHPELSAAADWAASVYHEGWIWPRALRRGIGLHHGRLPRALGQYAVRMFNDLKLRFLICTSTLIEGVNTKAKNVVVFDNKIAREQIDFFTFNNIKGRSGRMFHHFIGHVYLFADPPPPHLPYVDFPIFTQNERAPDSLLVQIEEDDLQPLARKRTERWLAQDVLPVAIIRENATIDPGAQIELAHHLQSERHTVSEYLSWRRTPSPEQLRYACSLIWDHLADVQKSRGGVFTARQLAFKIWQLNRVKATRDRIRQELQPGEHGAKSADEAVERVLQFERTWAGFEFPRLLMALSRIQSHVLGAMNLPTGDYSYFAMRVESLFRSPVVAALDEYGIPLQVAEKITRLLNTEDDLDLALSNLKSIDLSSLDLGPFERELLADAQSAI